MRYPTDVPIHRPSVVAMKVTAGTEEPRVFKPYVYRGTGEDQYPDETEQPKPKRKPLSATKRRRANEKRRKTVLDKETPQRKTPEELHKIRAMSAHKANETRRRMKQKADKYWAARQAEREAARAELVALPRPAPGWKPTAGEDIDNWLNEMED